MVVGIENRYPGRGGARLQNNKMKAIEIEKVLRRSPFRPFFLLIDNGTWVRVAHPDCVLFSQSKASCAIAEGREGFFIADTDHLSGLSFEPPRKNGGDARTGQCTSFLHIRAVPREKSSWVRAANRHGKKLAQWVTESLNRAADLEQIDSEEDLI